MKKSGFTLAEVLIAVGIIGVMGAIMATTFNNVKPDRTKFLYLKAYDGLKASINAMIYDSHIYSKSYDVTNNDQCISYDVSYYPLLDFSAPVNPDFSDIPAGQFKFANLLRESLNGQWTQLDQTQQCNSNDNCSFTTKPGNLLWTIRNQTAGLTTAPITGDVDYDINVELQIRRNNNDNNTPPSNFLFHVYADGTVKPDDGDDGFRYIMHRTNLRSQNDDLSVTSRIHDTHDHIQIEQEGTGTDFNNIYYTTTPGDCGS